MTLALAGSAHAFTVEIACPSSNPLRLAVDRVQVFEAAAYDGQQDITSEVAWSWDFDDGSGADTDNPTEHAYETAGDYTVTVTATWSAQQAQDQLDVDAQEPTGNYVLARQTGVNTYVSVEGDEICHRRFIIAFDDQDIYDWVAFACRRAGEQEYGTPTYVYRHEAQQITLDGQQRDHAFIYQWATDEAPGQAAAGWHNGAVDWHIEASYLDWEMEEVFEVVGEDTWTIGNTVVSSSGGVLRYDPDDENLDECEISWTTSHVNADAQMKFIVPIAIYDLAGTLMYNWVETEAALGADNSTWYGTIFPQEPEGPTQATKGIYTYTVGVVGESGTCGGVGCSCPTLTEGCARGDWDKSAFLEITDVTTPVWDVDLLEQEIHFSVSYSLNRAANGIALRVYGPDLTQVFARTGLPMDAGINETSTYDIPISLTEDWCGPYHVVLEGWESGENGGSNRDRTIKPALQKGVVRAVYPRAETFVDASFGGVPEIADYQSEVWAYRRYQASYQHNKTTRGQLEDYSNRGFAACALLTFWGHANDGSIYILYNPDLPTQAGAIHGCRSILTQPWEVAIDDHYGDWGHSRAIIFMGCDSGGTDPDEGCLPLEAVSAGSAWSVGWNQHISIAQGSYWLKRFYFWACENGNASGWSMDKADQDTEAAFGDSYDERLEDRNVEGMLCNLTPAGYGRRQ